MESSELPADVATQHGLLSQTASLDLPETDEEVVIDENGEVPADLLETIREAQAEVRPFGRTKVMEVPGYHGLLAVEYQYVGSEVTEAIARKVRRETRPVDGKGTALLSSIDTLRAACKRVLCRRAVTDDWMSVGGSNMPVVRLDSKLARLLNFDADNGRETVLGLFGSEHAIIQSNVILSNWMSDKTRESDEDFLL
jgi:hypothetical protein